MTYKDLKVWQKSIELVKLVYDLVKPIPKTENYSLVDPIKKCSIAVAANIAEGSERQSSSDNIRFLYISKGTLAELETHFIIAHELGYLNDESFANITSVILDIQKMLISFINYKKEKKASVTKPEK